VTSWTSPTSARLGRLGLVEDQAGVLSLTVEGAHSYEAIANRLRPLSQQIYADLDPSDLAIAYRVLSRIT
jgi:hypothetical protein